MTHRTTQLLLGLALIAGVSCIDMSAPGSGPASISTLQAPALYVVRRDSMRDSAGAVAPLSLTAFDQHGTVLPGVTPSFFVTDTGRIARIVAGDLVVAADTTGLVHVVGQVGNIQTPAVIVYITEAPAKLVSALSANDTLIAKAGADTISGRGTQAATVRVVAADGTTGVGGVVVHFALVHLPDTTAGNAGHAVYIAGDDGKLSSVDTADGSGQVSRTVVVLTKYLASTTDSVIVEATASYRGHKLANSPLQLTIPVRPGFGK